jgi:2-oxoglutarate dehydrogenase E2 component (dihydrolipoamide succinyltransferase)
MAKFELLLPKMGESVAEATITKWLKNEGDRIEMEESILEIATDKVDSEVPSPEEGILVKKLFQEGEVAQVGSVIAIIETAKNASVENLNSNVSALPSEKAAEKIEQEISQIATNPVIETIISKSSGDKFYSPLVRTIASTEGINQSELDALTGTGKDGRVTKNDILAYLGTRKNNVVYKNESVTVEVQKTIVETPKQIVPTPSVYIPKENEEIIEMDRMRKLISENMVKSKQTSAHVTSFVEADVTNIVKWRDKIKKSFEQREGEKITFTPIFIEAVAQAIKDFPMINVSVNGTQIIKKNYINIGMATALPSGNLIVPVIKNADQRNLLGLTKEVNRLANNARNNKLKPEEIQDGTFTLTNVGSFGNVMGTPIIMQPQVAILAVGAIRKLPAVIETPEGDFIGIRHKMFLSHTYDHRVVDGSLGGQFVRRVADILEAFDINRKI